MRRHLFYFSIFCLGLVASIPAARAFTLDWTTATPAFSNGSTDHTFVDVDGSGIDIRVRFAGDDNFINNTPAAVSLGSPVNQDVLQVFMDWESSSDRLTVRFEFYRTGVPQNNSNRALVQNLTFSIFDIDRRGTSGSPDPDPPGPYVYQDRINGIAGRDLTNNFNNAGIYPTLTAGSGAPGSVVIANGGSASASVTGIGYYDSEDARGRVDMNFGETAGVRFRYRNGPDAPSNPNGQTVLFGALTFVIPEPGTWVAAASLFGLFFFPRRLRR